MSGEVAKLDALSLRPYVPAKDFTLCRVFYEALGFTARELDAGLLDVRLGDIAFLLQDFFVREWAENFMMFMMVEDIAAWWSHVEALDLPGRFGVQAPRAPRREPWGLTVAYVFDPSGVLWHLAARD